MRTILHVDMNNFFASVESLLNPALKNKAIAVCGDREARHGIVLAKNEIAKKYGVKTAEPIYQALKKCPVLEIVKPNYDMYVKYSRLAREIYKEYTDMVEPFGIDECWLDVTGSRLLFGDGVTIGNTIRNRIKNELGLTVSVGVSNNKIYAKLGSDMKKPDALTEVPFEQREKIVYPLKVSEMIGIGSKTETVLKEHGIETLGELVRIPDENLVSICGSIGPELKRMAAGLDTSEVAPDSEKAERKSISHGFTTPKDITDSVQAKSELSKLCADIGAELAEEGKIAGTVSVTVRNELLKKQEFQCPLKIPTSSETVIAEKAYELFNLNYNWEFNIRSLTVKVSNLLDNTFRAQLDLFNEAEDVEKKEKLDKAIIDIRKKYGGELLKKGSAIPRGKE